jgi:putative tricarboxylic transport membrane protein
LVGLEALLGDIGQGAATAFSATNLFYCLIGVTFGTFIGVLPGVGVLSTVAMLMPLTFRLDPTSAIIMMAGIYYGAAYGGSTASILLNLPGTAQTAITCLDGHPMAKQGRGGVALFMTTIASFVGSIVGMLILAAFAIPLAQLTFSFRAPEYFALMLTGLLGAALMSTDAPFKSLAMVALGVVLGLVGLDVNSGMVRMAFGIQEIYDGLPLVAIALGLFGLPEVLRSAGKLQPVAASLRDVRLRDMLPTREDWRRSWGAIFRGTGIGAFFGALPGTGGTIAAFISYAVEKRASRHPEQFGHGAIEGIAGPEAANNSAVQTAFIPTLTLGIPGDAVMALILAVLMINGIQPGPDLVSGRPDMFWGLILSFLIGNVMLLIVNIPLIRVWIAVLSIPYGILFPAIIMFMCIGVYSVNYAIIDIYILLAAGGVGYVMTLLKLPPAQLILGLILGPLIEEHFRRAMQLARGDFLVFFERPISAFFLTICILMLAWTAWGLLRRRPRRLPLEEDGTA